MNEEDRGTLKVKAARFDLSRSHPYLSTAIWACTLVPAPGLGTFASDRHWRVYYDPKVADEAGPGEVTGMVYHELGHIIRLHSARAQAMAADKDRFNDAGDLEINAGIRAENMRLPDWVLYPEQFGFPAEGGMITEEYYALLPEKEKHNLQAASGKGSSKNGTSGTGEPEKDPRRRCGSGAGGERLPCELGPEEQSGVPGVSRARGEIIRRQVATEIKNWKDSGRGAMPGHWERWAEEILPSKISWHEKLRGAVGVTAAKLRGMVDYSYHRPSRRQGVAGAFILPAMIRPEIHIAVITDTSGSMNQQMIAQSLAEIRAIILTHSTAISLISCDTEVQSVQSVFPGSPIEKLKGGGGSIMTGGIEKAVELRARMIIVLTDADVEWPSDPPRNAKVIVVRFGSGAVPDWAETIDLDVEPSMGRQTPSLSMS